MPELSVKSEEDRPYRKLNLWPSVNTFLTTVLAIAMLAIAIAQYFQAEASNQLSKRLAELEFARATPDFDVSLGTEFETFERSEGALTQGVPKRAELTLVSGVMESWISSGRIIGFVSSSNGRERCPLAIHGVLKQNSRSSLSLISESAISSFFDSVEGNNLKIEGLHTEFFVTGTSYGEGIEVLTVTADGDEISEPLPYETFVVYNGEWSGGSGFYYDNSPSGEFCPSIRSVLTKLVDATNGYSGDEVSNGSPTKRLLFGQP